MQKAGVDIRLSTEVTPELVEEIGPDVLVIAVGSEPVIPRIDGIERAVMADDLPDSIERIGRRVAILGGGLVGCESAVYLAQTGRSVTVVEMRGDVAQDANPRHRPILLEKLDSLVTCLADTRAIRITDAGLVCEAEDGLRLVEADTVVCAAGRLPLRDVVEALRDSAPYVDVIGDCVKPSNVANAVFRGHFAALDI